MAFSNLHVLQVFIIPDGVCAVCDNDMSSAKVMRYPDAMCVKVPKLLKAAIKKFPNRRFKAIHIMLNDHVFSRQQFLRDCHKFCNDNAFFCYFTHLPEISITAALLEEKLIVSEGEKIIICFVDVKDVKIYGCIRRKEAYEVELSRQIDMTNTENYIAGCFLTVSNYFPKKVIVLSSAPPILSHYFYEQQMIALFRTSMCGIHIPKVIDNYFHNIMWNASYIACLDAMGEKINPYKVKPFIGCAFIVTHDKTSLVEEKEKITLPYEKSCIVKVKSKTDNVKVERTQVGMNNFSDEEDSTPLFLFGIYCFRGGGG